MLDNAAKRRMVYFSKAALSLSIVLYFVFHLLSGNKGLFMLFKLEAQLKELKVEAAQVAEERAAMQKKVRGLYDQSLDKEVLEEQVRRSLSIIPPEEKVYYPEVDPS